MNEATLLMALHLTARTTFVVFVGVFIGPDLRELWPSVFSMWLSRRRDWLIVGTAASHTIHLAAIVAYFQLVGWSRLHPLRLAPGGFTYLVIYALAVAATMRLSSMKEGFLRVGSKSERFALYLIWFVFASAFVPRIGSGWPAYSFFGVLALASLTIRIAGRMRHPQATT